MHDLYNLKDMLCRELKQYGKSGELSLSSLEMIDTLAHAAKNVEKIIECEDKAEYSRRNEYSNGGYYYDDGNSYRRGRDRMGRFVSRDGSEMARKLRGMMEDAPDEASRREIQRLAEKMESI